MINMKTYDLKDCFDVYKETVERKRDKVSKTELQNIENSVKKCYNEYKTHFNNNDLECLAPAKVGQAHKGVLLDLFNSQNKIVQDFRKRFFEINKQTYNNLCPYCVINSSNTTDHILPKEEYPEFAINVLNLIPCCGNCNGVKGKRVVNDKNERLFLNFYTDNLPNVQFLFLNIFNSADGKINFNYRIENINNVIDSQLFGLIERHFSNLGLLKEYDIKAIQQFEEITNLYIAQSFTSEQDFDKFARNNLNAWKNDIKSYGINHWKQVLNNACATSPIFKQNIMDKLRV